MTREQLQKVKFENISLKEKLSLLVTCCIEQPNLHIENLDKIKEYDLILGDFLPHYRKSRFELNEEETIDANKTLNLYKDIILARFIKKHNPGATLFNQDKYKFDGTDFHSTEDL